MHVAILCGGKGLRLNGGSTPKALAEVKDRPLVEHVISIYRTPHLGAYNEYHLLLGYNGDKIRLHYLLHPNSRVKLVETGKETQTAGRLLRAREYIDDGRTFAVAYCDCLADVDIDEVLTFHRSHGRLATLVAVPVVSKFGVLSFKDLPFYAGGHIVHGFSEKPKTSDWVNFGFFLFEPDVWSYIGAKSVHTVLEQDVLPILAKEGQLVAFRHNGFSTCADSPKDLEQLNAIEGTPWLAS